MIKSVLKRFCMVKKMTDSSALITKIAELEAQLDLQRTKCNGLEKDLDKERSKRYELEDQVASLKEKYSELSWIIDGLRK